MSTKKGKRLGKRGTRKNARGEATCARVLDCARELLREQGYPGLSIARVCERAEVSPTSVYWHFGDKAGLMAAVLAHVSRHHAEHIAAAVPAARSSKAAAQQTLAAIRELVLTQPLGALTGVAVLAEGKHVSRELLKGLRRTRDQERVMISQQLTAAGGAWARSAEDLAIIATAVTNYAAICYRLDHDEREVDQILTSLRVLLDLRR